MSLTPDSHSDKPVHGQFKENSSVDASGPLEANVDREFERKTLQKVDRRLLIILGALYAVSLIDRTNISVARVAGMSVDLKLNVGERYSIISAIFFAPYVVFELPSNILMRKIGCRVHLSSIVILWGAVMLGMGFIKTWEQLAVCRVLLGLLEAGFFPGCVYLISCWYTRFETQKRMAVFYLTSMVISGFSQIIGYAFTLLGGRHGIAPWRWVFILFGVITIGLGIIAAFLIVDFPDKNKFLTAEQTKLMVQRVELDRGDAEPDSLTATKFFRHAIDFKLWLFGFAFCFSTMPAYAFSYFLPVILAGGGFDTKTSLCLSAPPYVFAAIYTFCVAYGSDKTRMRGAFIVLSATVCMVGLFIMAFGGKLGVRYFGSFLAIAGCQANVPAVLTYQANNILSHSKRAVGSAIVIGMGGVGGIFASLVYRQEDFPKYLPGLGATIGCQGAIMLIVAGLSLYFSRKNKKAEQGEAIEGNPNFRYTL